MLTPEAGGVYFFGCLYLKIYLDVIFCITTEVVQALRDFIEIFVKSGVEGEMDKNITTIVNFLLVVFAKLADINDLPSKAKLHVLECFFKFLVDVFRAHFILMLNQ